MKENPEFLLTRSKTFCILPWLHLYTSPVGNKMSCCVATKSFYDKSLKESFNSDFMKQLRLDMLNETFNENCSHCYEIEKSDATRSLRKSSLTKFNHHTNLIGQTKKDGSLDEFKLRYFDVRFNNICNFKCRTCNSDYSTQWSQENHKHLGHELKVVADNVNLLTEVKEQIVNLESVYFAGGEPLITDEHYILLEELIKQNKTNIELVYNTNVSHLQYKDKDLIELWKNFKKVQVIASIDHYGERAEYIRHGTQWGLIESNVQNLYKVNNVSISIGTVLSVYNYLTITELYSYLKDKNILRNENTFSLYKMVEPTYLTARILPKPLKMLARQKVYNYKYIKELYEAVVYAEKVHEWDLQKEMFRNETHRLDKIRSENFIKVFPELGTLLNE